MSALGLESVLVGDVGDQVDNVVGAGVGVLAADLKSLALSSSILQLTLLLLVDAVGGLNTVEKTSY